MHRANPGDVAPIGTNPCAIPIAAEKPRGRLIPTSQPGDGYLVGIPNMSPRIQEQPWCAIEAGRVAAEVIENQSIVQ